MLYEVITPPRLSSPSMPHHDRHAFWNDLTWPDLDLVTTKYNPARTWTPENAVA